MKRIYNYLAIVVALLLFNGKAYSQASPYGVNLSGMEWGESNLPGTAGTNYFVPTSQEFTYYAGKGIKLFRIPFLWERMQSTLGGSLNTTYLSQLDGVVSAAASAGVSIILDCHNYARYPYNGNVITSSGGPTQANFDTLWTKLAAHYANNTTVWGYDLMNEPNNLGGVNWFNVLQSTITAIRTVDKTHTIIIEGNNWSHGNTWTSYNNNYYTLSDPNNNLVFEAHQYFDSDGSGNYSSNTVSGNGGNSNTGVTLITPFVNWCKNNNVKGMVGEFGVPNTADTANWNSMLRNFLAYLQTNCIMGTYWAGGPAWGSYALSCEPTNNYTTDASQMGPLKSYTKWGSGCTCTAPAATITSSKTTLCPGGSITLSANTGTGLTYQWNSSGTIISGATNSTYTVTASGSYTVTVKNSGNCSATSSSVAITNVAAPTAIAHAPTTTSFCGSGSATFTASTATGNTYQWNMNGSAISGATATTYTASATGTYTLTVTNSSGCSATSSATTVTVSADPTTANAGPTQYITTTSTTLAANTATTGTGKWTVVSGTGSFVNSASPTTTVSGLSTGANQLQWSITNGSCPASNSTVTINVGSVPPVQTVSGPTSVTANEQSVTYSVPYTTGNTYQWTVPTGATITSTGTNGNQITVTFGTSGGTVSVQETNSYGSSTSSTTVTTSVTAVIGSSSADSYQIYPNPFNSSVTIRVNNASGQVPLSISITDLQGVVCYSSSAYYTNENIVTGEQLPAGLYIVQLVYGSQSNVAKLIKMQ